jgi:hypothetical protein
MSYDPWETPPEERKARFVGREALLERLLSGVAQQEGHQTVQHYLLLGPRGIGKTSILLTVRDRVRESAALSARWFCVQLREEEYFIRTLRDLLELVLRALAEEEGLPDAAEVVERVHQEKREERSLAVAVEGLRNLAAGRGRRILLLIDNFDRLFPATAAGRRKTRPAENEFRAFRKLLSKESFLMVVGASVRVFEEIAAYDQAFFNFFSPVEIPNLSESEICELLRKCAEVEKNTAFLEQFEALRDKVRAITYLTGGNPRLVVMLYDVLRQHEMAPVVEALRETVGGLTPLLKHVLDDMPRQQSKTLDALVRLRGAAPPNEIAAMARLPLNVVTAQLGRLKEARFVVVEGERADPPPTGFPTRCSTPGIRCDTFAPPGGALSFSSSSSVPGSRWRSGDNSWRTNGGFSKTMAAADCAGTPARRRVWRSDTTLPPWRMKTNARSSSDVWLMSSWKRVRGARLPCCWRKPRSQPR